jgi:hypothetical protein
VSAVRPARPFFRSDDDIEAVIGIGQGRLPSPAARIYHIVVAWFADEQRVDGRREFAAKPLRGALIIWVMERPGGGRWMTRGESYATFATCSLGPTTASFGRPGRMPMRPSSKIPRLEV